MLNAIMIHVSSLQVSAVYYMNKDYESDHGGVERLFFHDTKKVIDVEPIFNRLLLFWSDMRTVHGTCRCYVDIFQLSAWYFTHRVYREEGEARDGLKSGDKCVHVVKKKETNSRQKKNKISRLMDFIF